MKYYSNIVRPLVIALALMFSVTAFVGISAAAGPVWSSGYPKLLNKNVMLQWISVKGATEYKVYRDEGKGKKLIVTVKTNRYIDKNIPSGKKLAYSIGAVIGGKEGELSQEASVATATEKVFVPLKIPKLDAGMVKDLPGGKVSIGIHWDGAGGSDLVGINVYRSAMKGKDYAMIGSSAGSSYDDKDVKPGATYYYVVTSVDDKFNETGFSNEIKVEVPRTAVMETTPAKGAIPTKMRRAKLLFRIEKCKDIDGTEIPLSAPVSVAVDEAVGHIYIVSGAYDGILVYGMDGAFQFGIRRGGAGSDQKFNNANGVCIGQNGTIYAADYGASGIAEFDGMDGRLKGTVDVDTSSIPDAKTPQIYCALVNSAGNIFADDPANNRVHVIGPDGKSLFHFGPSTEKKENPHFNGPSFMALDSKDNLYLVDTGFSRILKYDSKGKYLATIGTIGIKPGELNYPAGLAFDKGDVLFVANAMDSNVQAFNTSGKFLYALANEKGEGPIPSDGMRGIFIDSKDRLYVTELYNNRVSVYQLTDKLEDVIPPAKK